MANALETTVTTASQVASKAASLQEAVDQVANAVNLPNVIDLSAGGTIPLTTDDLYRHGILEFTGVSGAVVDVTWPANEARQILVFCDETNTHNVEVTHGATTYALEPGGAYWLYSNGDTDHLKALHIALLGASPVGYVNKAGDTMTGALILPAGSVALPALGIGDAVNGFYQTAANEIGVSINGSLRATWRDGGLVLLKEGSTGDINLSCTVASTTGGDNAAFQLTRIVANANAPSFQVRKGRGTTVSGVTAVLQNDVLGNYYFLGYSGATYTIGASIVAIARAATPSGSDFQTRLVGNLCASGSASVTEIWRFEHATGLSMFGANVVINQDRGVVLRSTTIAGSATITKTTGTKYWISDYRGGVEVVYDGTSLVIPGIQYLQVAASDESTALTTGTSKIKFRAPCAMKLSSSALPRASLSTAQASGSIFTVDINEGATTILSTKLTIDNTESTSTTAATPCVLSDTSIADDAEMHIDIDQIGDGTAKGLKVTIPYREIVA